MFQPWQVHCEPHILVYWPFKLVLSPPSFRDLDVRTEDDDDERLPAVRISMRSQKNALDDMAKNEPRYDEQGKEDGGSGGEEQPKLGPNEP